VNDPTLRERLRRYVTQLSPSAGYLVGEFVENYEDGAMARRDLLERVLRITGSAATAASVLLALGVKPAHADPLASASFQAQPPSAPMSPFSVPEGDPSISTADVTFPSGGATMLAYLARPNASGRFPAVLVQHENMGTAEHFRDVARRFAKNGYVALHLDLFSRQGAPAPYRRMSAPRFSLHPAPPIDGWPIGRLPWPTCARCRSCRVIASA